MVFFVPNSMCRKSVAVTTASRSPAMVINVVNDEIETEVRHTD